MKLVQGGLKVHRRKTRRSTLCGAEWYSERQITSNPREVTCEGCQEIVEQELAYAESRGMIRG